MFQSSWKCYSNDSSSKSRLFNEKSYHRVLYSFGPSLHYYLSMPCLSISIFKKWKLTTLFIGQDKTYEEKTKKILLFKFYKQTILPR